MSKKKSAPLLLTDDIALDSDREQRSEAVKECTSKLAQKLGTSVEIIHVENLSLYPVRTPQYKPLIDRYFREQKALLASMASSLKVPTKSFFLNGDPTKKILAHSSKRNAYEMVILGTHGRTGLKRLILGSVAEEVIRQSKIPVMTVGPKAQKKAARFLSGSKIKILVPTSLTANSAHAEAYSLSLANKLGGEVIFFHSMYDALHPVLQTASSVPSSLQDYFKTMKTSLQKQLSSKVEKSKKRGIAATYSLNDETISSSEAVLKEAERVGADLIIMGTHGRSMVSRAFFGRTARDVILDASVPVITVHSKMS